MEIGPIFSWADNYDLHIATPNGMKTTHTMGMEFTQRPAGIMNADIGVMQLKIPRLRKHETSNTQLADHGIQLEHYVGPSKRNPPLLQPQPLSPNESQLQSASVKFGQERDALWLSQVHGSDKPIEWAGFNIQQDRLQNSMKKSKTHVVDGPMIDSSSAHPDTVLTTLIYLEKAMRSFGMQYTHLTVDLQLYQTACLIQWNDPHRWSTLVLHSGMMHTLMSFLGCIGTLMKGSSVDIFISAAFGGLAGIISGKSWNNALRAYRLITAMLLHTFYTSGAKTYQELSDYRETMRHHPTGRRWVDCLIKPTLLALMFHRGERNGDFLRQQYCLKQMLPYFFAAGHQNYARYISRYVRQMEHLPDRAKEDLLAGAHVCRHSDGATVVPEDQFGEQTYIKIGKGTGGMKGISTSAEQVAVWVNSFGVCSHLRIAMESMYLLDQTEEQPSEEDADNSGTSKKHKEEGESRRKLDEEDRNKIAYELEKHSHPLTEQHDSLYNICNGHVAPDTVNVQDALRIGEEQSSEFSLSLSNNFHPTIKKKVKTMEVIKRSVTVKGKAIYDVETLFGRLLVVGQQRGVDIADVFQYELSPVPPSLIDEYGNLSWLGRFRLKLVHHLTQMLYWLMEGNFYTMLSGQSTGPLENWLLASAIDSLVIRKIPRSWCCSTNMMRVFQVPKITKDQGEGRPNKFVWPQTPHCHVGIPSCIILQTNVVWIICCVLILWITTYNLSIILTALWHMVKLISPSVATCWSRPRKEPTPSEFLVMILMSLSYWCIGYLKDRSIPEFKWKNGMGLSLTSTKLSNI